MAFRWIVLGCVGLLLSISNVVAAQALSTNTVVHGAIGLPGQSQSYTFSANPNNSAYVSCVERDLGSPFAPRISVLNPSLALVTQGEGNERAFASLQTDSAGTYTVRIESLGNATGNYDLYFAQEPGPSELGALLDGEVGRGTIDRGDIDTFNFTASAGQTVELSVVDSGSSSLQPTFGVTGPDGSRVFTASTSTSSGGATEQFRAGQTGDFSLAVYDSGTVGTGDYDVHIAHIPGANEGGLLANDGAAVHDTIDLGDIDSFTFVANQGDPVLLRVAKLGGSVDFRPFLRVYRPSGELQTAGIDPVFRAQDTGTYTVIAVHERLSFPSFDTGPYSLHFARVPGANERGTLALGQVGSGTFEAGDLESYTFTPPQASALRVNVNVQPGQVTTTRIYDPTGTLLAQTSNSAGVSTYTVPAALLATPGVHTLIISGDAGSYNVSWRLSTPVPLPFWVIPLLGVALFTIGYAASRRRLRSS